MGAVQEVETIVRSSQSQNAGNPYPGPRPFSTSESQTFFGRECETRDVFSLVSANRVVLVYSQSGAGKTSLINAGLLPLLTAEKEFEVLPVARVGGAVPVAAGNPFASIYVLAALMCWADSTAPTPELLRCSLSSALKSRPQRIHKGIPAVRIAIFDQFEELFTTHASRWKEREVFFLQLRNALRDDPYLKVLFSMREEYIAQLDPFEDIFLESFDRRYRLERLGREASLEAINAPMLRAGRRFAKGVAEKLVRDLARERVQVTQDLSEKADTGVRSHSRFRNVVGQYIEPVQLQVVCNALWQVPSFEITADDLRNFGNVTRALSQFYDETVRFAAERGQISEDKLRRFFSERLLTSVGTRGTVYGGDWGAEHIPPESVIALESKYLIRAEFRAGTFWHELIHDRFIDPIQTSNKSYFAEQARTLSKTARRLEETLQKGSTTLTDDDFGTEIDDGDTQSLFSAIAKQIRLSIDFDLCTISELSTDSKHTRLLFHYPETKMRQNRWSLVPPLLRRWIRQQSICVEDVEAFFQQPALAIRADDPDYKSFRSLGFISMMRFPIVLGRRVAASMTVWSKHRQFKDKDVSIFSALPVEQTLLAALYYRERSELQFRLRLMRELSVCATNQGVADLLVKRLAEHYGWQRVCIYRVNSGRHLFELQSKMPTKLCAALSQELPDGILGYSYRRNKDTNVGNVKQDPKFAKMYLPLCIETPFDTTSELCMPIRSRDRVLAMLNVESMDENVFTKQEVQATRSVLDLVGETMGRVTAANLITASFDATPTAVFILDSDGVIEKVNPSALHLMHYKEKQLVGTPLVRYLSDSKALDAVLRNLRSAPEPTDIETGRGKTVRVLFKANRAKGSNTVVVSALVLKDP